MAGILYVVGTPIGNLGDMSERAVETLKNVDFIAAEDTRVTVKLLNRFDIKKPMESYYEHNIRQKGEKLCARILSGESCAIVSDAGMPCISDPGEDLVNLCASAGIEIRVVPLANAAISALCISGLSASRFCFEGFLSVNKKNRTEHLKSLTDERRTMIFYEAPHKLLHTLKDILDILGDRRIAIAKELTKIHERVERMTLSESVLFYENNTPKGEYVLVIEGKKKLESEHEEISFEEVVNIAKNLIQNGLKATEAAKESVKNTSYKKSDVYKKLQ